MKVVQSSRRLRNLAKGTVEVLDQGLRLSPIDVNACTSHQVGFRGGQEGH